MDTAQSPVTNGTGTAGAAQHPHDFTRRLPVELLTHIFDMAVGLYHHRRRLDICLVSSRWKEVTMQTASLWRGVDCKMPIGYIEACLNRSMNCRLTILNLDVSQVNEHTQQIYELVVQHISRWESINLIVSFPLNQIAQNLVDTTAPNLRYIDIRSRGGRQARLLNPFSGPLHVRSLYLDDTVIFPACRTVSNINSLELRLKNTISGELLRQLLEAATNITILDLRLPKFCIHESPPPEPLPELEQAFQEDPTGQTNQDQEQDPPQGTNETPPRIRLPHLRHIKLGGCKMAVDWCMENMEMGDSVKTVGLFTKSFCIWEHHAEAIDLTNLHSKPLRDVLPENFKPTIVRLGTPNGGQPSLFLIQRPQSAQDDSLDSHIRFNFQNGEAAWVQLLICHSLFPELRELELYVDASSPLAVACLESLNWVERVSLRNHSIIRTLTAWNDSFGDLGRRVLPRLRLLEVRNCLGSYEALLESFVAGQVAPLPNWPPRLFALVHVAGVGDQMSSGSKSRREVELALGQARCSWR